MSSAFVTARIGFGFFALSASVFRRAVLAPPAPRCVLWMRAVLEVDAEAVRLVDAWCVGDGDDGDATDGERTAAVGGEGGTELGRVAMGFPRPKCNMVVTSFFIMGRINPVPFTGLKRFTQDPEDE